MTKRLTFQLHEVTETAWNHFSLGDGFMGNLIVNKKMVRLTYREDLDTIFPDIGDPRYLFTTAVIREVEDGEETSGEEEGPDRVQGVQSH